MGIQLSIEVQEGGTTTGQFHFDSDHMTIIKIGSLSSAHVQLKDPRVSRVHAVIELASTEARIIDMGGTVGTKLNGQVISKARLKHGDRLAIADATLVVSVAGGAVPSLGASGMRAAGSGVGAPPPPLRQPQTPNPQAVPAAGQPYGAARPGPVGPPPSYPIPPPAAAPPMWQTAPSPMPQPPPAPVGAVPPAPMAVGPGTPGTGYPPSPQDAGYAPAAAYPPSGPGRRAQLGALLARLPPDALDAVELYASFLAWRVGILQAGQTPGMAPPPTGGMSSLRRETSGTLDEYVGRVRAARTRQRLLVAAGIVLVAIVVYAAATMLRSDKGTFLERSAPFATRDGSSASGGERPATVPAGAPGSSAAPAPPAGSGPAAAAPAGPAGEARDVAHYVYYETQAGDTVSSIARKLLWVPAEAGRILEANPNIGSGTAELSAGSVLKIPRFFTYTVKPGDTLGDIAGNVLGDESRFSLIAAANRDKLADPSALDAGMELAIPLLKADSAPAAGQQ